MILKVLSYVSANLKLHSIVKYLIKQFLQYLPN